jgi:hypothetical protein
MSACRSVHGDARADADLVVGDGDLLQVAAVLEEDRLFQRLQPLGDPEPDIGGPGDQRGLGVRGVEPGQFIGRARCPGGFGDRRIVARDLGQRVVQPAGHRRLCRGLSRTQDRRVAGAAAQVAGKLRLSWPVSPLRCAVAMADDEAGRAEAALRPVMLDHGLLHRVQLAIGTGEAFDRAQRAAVELRQEEDAGVQRTAALRVGHHHGAGTAVAFVAALLGAGQAAAIAQPVEQRGRRRRIDSLRFPVQKKPDRHPCLTPPRYLIRGWSSRARCGVERGPVCPVRPKDRKPALGASLQGVMPGKPASARLMGRHRRECAAIAPDQGRERVHR